MSWAISATSSLEGDWFITAGMLSVFSKQQLVVGDMFDSVCNNKIMDNSFAFGEKNDPCTEASKIVITPQQRALVWL